MSKRKLDSLAQFTESPTSWFAALERAWRTGDYALAEKATAELGRLGVLVAFEGDMDLAAAQAEREAQDAELAELHSALGGRS